MKNITGVGILLKTTIGTFLLQERDEKAKKNPGMIAPFGGGIDGRESPAEGAIRELEEELELHPTINDLEKIEVFESHTDPGKFLQLFLLKNVDPAKLILHEGKSIKEMSLNEVLNHPQVTDFTKEVLMVYKTRHSKML